MTGNMNVPGTGSTPSFILPLQCLIHQKEPVAGDSLTVRYLQLRREESLRRLSNSMAAEASTSNESNFSGFSTASDKPIYVDPEVLKKAKEKYCFDDGDVDFENFSQKPASVSPVKSFTQSFASPLMKLSTTNTPETFSTQSPVLNPAQQALMKGSKKGFVSPLHKSSQNGFSSPILAKNSPLSTDVNPNPAKRRFSAPFRAPMLAPEGSGTSPRIADVKREARSLTPRTTSVNATDLPTPNAKVKTEEIPTTSSADRALVIELCDIAQYAHKKIDMQGRIVCMRARTKHSQLSFALEDDWENGVECCVFTKNEDEIIAKLRLGKTVTIRGVFVKCVQEKISLVVNDNSTFSYE
ncbi:unnamed protein product [Auanema sp. JU1783]|nr:unnamed protein product [Auanema sp. JU1783]